MKTIRWGMVGCGDVTEKKSGPCFYKARNSALHAVTNRTKAKAENYALRHNVPKVYDNITNMLEDPEIDAIYIATPPDSHKDYSIMCAKATKPCYIEKPLALYYSDCIDMIKAFEATNTKAFAAYYRRRLPRFMKVKELLDNGDIGEVRFAHVSYYRPVVDREKNGYWHVQPKISGGGIFMDIAVHQLDVLDFLMGKISDVKSIYSNQAGYYEPEDILNCCFSFENGAQAGGDWCFSSGIRKDCIEIVGSLGRITFECFGRGSIIMETVNGTSEFILETPEHIQMGLIQSIIDELNGEDTCPSTLVSATRTAWVCDRVYGNMP
ncbi:MAG: Gfo/Idh/MocA family oxidoreductase [Defluviitaleaceae bacterium]|nr:Gfo/Idh/MocA family oxidoreductase [Defluviitaleaceae bacterium]